MIRAFSAVQETVKDKGVIKTFLYAFGAWTVCLGAIAIFKPEEIKSIVLALAIPILNILGVFIKNYIENLFKPRVENAE